MRLAIFGATGRTGRHLLEQALEAGHEVRALARDPQRLPDGARAVDVVEGDALDAAHVAKTIAGTEAVLSALGHARDSPPDLLTRFTENAIAAMLEEGPRRLVVLTGAGVRDEHDEPKLVDRAYGATLKLTSRKLLDDSTAMVRRLEESDLDWVVVRAPRLVEGPRTDGYNVGFVGRLSGVRANRGEVADFMLRQIEGDAWLGRAPLVSS